MTEIDEGSNNLINYARRELELINESPDVIDGYLTVVAAFAAMDHSDVPVSIHVLQSLMSFKPLSSLTDNSDEWMHVGDDVIGGSVLGKKVGIWQSKRDPEAFSNDGGKTYYLLSERDKLRGKSKSAKPPVHKSHKYKG